MNKKLSIIYCTARKQPKFEWFVEYIVKEYNGNVTDEIIFVDIFLYFDLLLYLQYIFHNHKLLVEVQK